MFRFVMPVMFAPHQLFRDRSGVAEPGRLESGEEAGVPAVLRKKA